MGFVFVFGFGFRQADKLTDGRNEGLTNGRTAGIYFHVSASNCCESFAFLFPSAWGHVRFFLVFLCISFAFKMLPYNATLYGHVSARVFFWGATIFAIFYFFLAASFVVRSFDQYFFLLWSFVCEFLCDFEIYVCVLFCLLLYFWAERQGLELLLL